MTLENAEAILDRFHRTLVEEIRASNPRYLDEPFTVAEIYQQLVPYRTHRAAIGVEINGDYEDALLRLLAGQGGYLWLDSAAARDRIVKELKTQNPDTSLYREFAAVEVRLNREVLDDEGDLPEVEQAEEGEAPVEAPTKAPPAGAAEAGGCRSCRRLLPERIDLVYCPYCGADQRLVPCPACGTELEPEWGFCIACGQAVEGRE